LPELPKGWTPDPRRLWEKDKENIAGDTISDATAAKTGKGRGKSELTAGEVCNLVHEFD
jgi:G patch domain-containing protein 1